MYTNYRRILFPLNDCRVRYITWNFPLNIVYNEIFLFSSKKKKAEMSFLRVSDLLLVCVVLYHNADSSLFIIRMIFSLKINVKLPLEKCV